MATHTIDRLVDANGDEFVFSDPDVSNKLDKNGDGSDVTVGFTEATNRTNIDTGRKLSTLFGQIRKWFADMGALAFKDTVGASDVESGTYHIDISGNAAKATTATTATATSSGTISAGNDLNNYNAANRNYLCNATNASSVSNKPSGASGAFELEVIRGTGSTCVQVYYSRDDVSFNYIRKYTGSNAWTAWNRVSLASNAGNADTVDGYHIVLGSPNGAANTIFLA